MSELKKKTSEADAEVYWDVVLQQQGLEFPSSSHQNTEAMCLLRNKLGFSDAEIKANRIGKRTRKQRLKLALYEFLRISPYLLPGLLFISASTFATIYYPEFKTFQILCFRILGIILFIYGFSRVRYNDVESVLGYIVPLNATRKVLHVTKYTDADTPAFPSLQIRANSQLYDACQQMSDLYRIYYSTNSHAILSAERVEP